MTYLQYTVHNSANAVLWYETNIEFVIKYSQSIPIIRIPELIYEQSSAPLCQLGSV